MGNISDYISVVQVQLRQSIILGHLFMDFLMKTRFIELCRIVMKTRNDVSYNSMNMSMSGDRCENTHDIGM